MKIVERKPDSRALISLGEEGVPLLVARALASRGVAHLKEVEGSLLELYSYKALHQAEAAASFLADCIVQRARLLVVADYDCDGATACAVAVRGLRAFGADVQYTVPDRMVHGYGLTPSIVDEIASRPGPRPDVLITVDNGIASHAGVARANALGMAVVVTDHHLPSKLLPPPAARVIVNPNQEGCAFPSKSIAGCGVVWYVLWALQDELRRRGMPIQEGFKVSQLLPLVAVGTVADVVPLDRNNRILVTQGLSRIREGNGQIGITALAMAGVISRCEPARLVTADIAFGIGPRINAAGRLATMEVGIDCLLSDSLTTAEEIADKLEALNQERREIEWDMVVAALEQAELRVDQGRNTIVVQDDDWHAGVIGIVAGRLKERHYRPTFVLTADESGEMKGSGRSIPGVHLKDLLDWVDKNHPGLLLKFGGHAMAAGVTVRAGGFEQFRAGFEAAFAALADPAALQLEIAIDGELPAHEISLETAEAIKQFPWGQGFPEPVFKGSFEVIKARIGGAHKDVLSLELEAGGHRFSAVRYRHVGPKPEGTIQLLYKLDIAYDKKGVASLKLLVDHILQAERSHRHD